MDKDKRRKRALRPIKLYVGLSVAICNSVGFDIIAFLLYGYASLPSTCFDSILAPTESSPVEGPSVEGTSPVFDASTPYPLPVTVSLLQHLQSIDKHLTIELHGDGSERQSLIASSSLTSSSSLSLSLRTATTAEQPSHNDAGDISTPLYFYINTNDPKLREKTVTFLNHVINLTKLAYQRHISIAQHRYVLDPLSMSSCDTNTSQNKHIIDTNTHRDTTTMLDTTSTTPVPPSIEILHYIPQSIEQNQTNASLTSCTFTTKAQLRPTLFFD